MKADGELLLEFFPDEVLGTVFDRTGMTREQFVALLNDNLENALDKIDSYGDWSYSCTVTDVQRLGEDAVNEFQRVYNEDLKIPIAITDAVRLKVDLRSECQGSEGTQEMTFALIKVRGEWYIEIRSYGLI